MLQKMRRAQLLILSSLLTVCGDDCLYEQDGRPLTPAERKAVEKEIEVVDDYIKEHSDLEDA